MTKLSSLLVPWLGVAVLAGCTSEVHRATTRPDTKSPVKTQSAADRAHAKSSTLQLADFPKGFAATYPDGDTRSPCVAFEEAKQGTSGRAKSATFRRGDSTQADNLVLVYSDEPTARKAFARLSAEATLACYAGSITKAFASQSNVEVGELRSEPLKLDALGDERAGTRATQALTVDGIDAEVIVEFVFVRAGRGVTMELFTDALKPFGNNLRDRLVEASAQRLADRLSA